MMIKRLPQDFQVEELTDVKPQQHGEFALYRLHKIGWTTPDALQAIRRRWKIDLRRVSYGGLKDRHADTLQYISIHNGPKQRLSHERIQLDYLGQIPEIYTSKDIRANRFRIVLRRMDEPQTEFALQALGEVANNGVPNYFDDQRFGSVHDEQGFAALFMVRGEWESALKLALTSPYEFDRAGQKKEKRLLRDHWGDWQACKRLLPRGHARSLVDFLCGHPQQYRGALERLRPELRGLLLSAFQSHIWNRMFALWLGEHIEADRLVEIPFKLRPLPMHRELRDEERTRLEGLAIPLPTARTKPAEDDPLHLLGQRVLGEMELEWSRMKIPGSRDLFFSKGDRPALCRPEGLRFQSAPDDVHPGKSKLTLNFDMPRGSYATILVKRISQGRHGNI